MAHKAGSRFRAFLPSQILVGSFAGAIIVGAAFLYLPASAVMGHTDFIDCLFTATSATCVTGLTVLGTGSHFTVFGRTVILTLIQLGGLGIMTGGAFMVMLFGGSLSLRERAIIKDTLNPVRPRRLGLIVVYAVIFTVFTEAVGAAILYGAFKPIVGRQKAYGTAVFHSISAFCNAGFSTFDTNLERLGSFPAITMTIMTLLIVGGLGFFVMLDLVSGLKKRLTGHHLKEAPMFTLHTRIVLSASGCLLLLGTSVLFALERNHVCADMSAARSLSTSLFLSATARTAGFSTVPIGELSDASLFLLILLMFIGASPGSTGGGIKTATLVLIGLFVGARIKGRSEVNVWGRRIPEQVINKSLAVTSLAVLALSLSLLALLVLERGSPASPSFMDLVFEATSAFGTVGLSTGITPSLTTGGKLVIILLMFVGRLGPLTVATLVATRARSVKYSFPEETVMVG